MLPVRADQPNPEPPIAAGSDGGATLRESGQPTRLIGGDYGAVADTEPAPEARQGAMIYVPRWVLAALILLAALLTAGAVYFGSSQRHHTDNGGSTTPVAAIPRGVSTPTATLMPTTDPLPTLPPPLARANFPKQAISYPQDWPTELRFPQEFVVVNTASGPSADSAVQIWTLKLRFAGNADAATEAMLTFLASRGWNAQQSVLSSGTHVVTIERNNGANGGGFEADTDPDDPASARILIAVRL